MVRKKATDRHGSADADSGIIRNAGVVARYIAGAHGAGDAGTDSGADTHGRTRSVCRNQAGSDTDAGSTAFGFTGTDPGGSDGRNPCENCKGAFVSGRIR